MGYVVAIPSYNRPNEIVKKTLKTLKDGGISTNAIYIFVANDNERKKYEDIVSKDLYGKIVVGKLGIANQRIFIKHYFKENQQVVSIDDDVEALFRMTNTEPAKLIKITNVDKFFKDAFDRLHKEKLFIWGIYPVRNPFFMQNKVTTSLKFIIGALYGFIVRKTPELEPSTNAEGKEDYEQSILYYKKDGGVLRYNNITIKTKFLAKGGLGEDRFAMNKKAAEYLQKTYPDLVTMFFRKNGMSEIRLANTKQIEPVLDKKTTKSTKSRKTTKSTKSRKTTKSRKSTK
jgi:hypothetical protein